MKIITGFLPPTGGKASVAGYDVVTHSVEARRHIGYLPETVPLYADMPVDEYLGFMGRIRGMSSDYVRRRIGDVVDICHLEDYKSTLISKLSKGFRQRVGIAQAILHEPDVLVLDEPTIGIDPVQVVETRQLIKDLGGEHTLIISTHILPEVSMICERVIIIHEGQIVAIDKPENLSERLSGPEHVEIDARGPQRAVSQALRGVDGVHEVSQTASHGGGLFSYTVIANPDPRVKARLASTVVGGGWDLMRLQSVGMSLEEIFLRLTTIEGEESET
jgi:ABC-2 type transport system ATP-binding protein